MLTCIDWFAGIGGMRLAFERAGWRCVWSCELDADARAVYAEHWGLEPDLRDIRDTAAAAIPVADCWVAGFPCQDLSCAGARSGFDGDRSALVFRLLDLAAVVRPPWLLLENVPGLLHVRGGRDFGALLCALEDAGYLGAWRVLDARWFGVPQRRRRVFVLARHTGAPGPDPAAILLESPRLRGSDSPRHPTRQDVARPLGGGTRRRRSRGYRPDLDHGALIADPISAHEGKTYSHEGKNNFRMRNVVAFDLAQVTHPENRTRIEPRPDAPSLAATNRLHLATQARVRRLTPRECERLQGFPDDWTARARGRRLRDASRFRLVGNSVAVPCVQWIAVRLARWLTTSAA